ncbi:MAG: DUF2716 domain-containing protein [Verrucomicrobiaceae bacterium]|nr:MAG: DUF2716 domain-containing protein [Verrucomicrobiaceae bacterium]
MSAWTIIPDQELDSIWDRFYNDFDFRPSMGTFPGIREPVPSVTYCLDSVYGTPEHHARMMEGFDDAALRICSAICQPSGRVLALDWQHPCYYFAPALHKGHWEVPPFPDGDYYIFLSEDFRDGWFGHPWEQTVCIFGQRALSSLETGLPMLFTKPVRQRTYPPV